MSRLLLWVFVAGGIGSCLRVVLAHTLDARLAERLPYVGTLCVNLLGCLAIGMASVWIGPGPLRTAIIGGLLGGVTTYSGFAQFSVDLVRDERTGMALLLIALHIVGGMVCAWAGLAIARGLGGGATSP